MAVDSIGCVLVGSGIGWHSTINLKYTFSCFFVAKDSDWWDVEESNVFDFCIKYSRNCWQYIAIDMASNFTVSYNEYVRIDNCLCVGH